MFGHCAQCKRIWTLQSKRGVCKWCGKLASYQGNQQRFRSMRGRRRAKQRQALTLGIGYDQLEGDWLSFYAVASRFTRKAKTQDRGDLLHDLMLTFAEVKRGNGHKPFTEAVMYRIASHKVADYWRGQYRLTNGLDCGSCNKAQRRKCKEEDLYTDCPKAIELESLSKPITDSEGNLTELGDLLADDTAIDLAEWLDIKTYLAGCPQKLITIALKKREGQRLNETERKYLFRYRQKTQTSLF